MIACDCSGLHFLFTDKKENSSIENCTELIIKNWEEKTKESCSGLWRGHDPLCNKIPFPTSSFPSPKTFQNPTPSPSPSPLLLFKQSKDYPLLWSSNTGRERILPSLLTPISPPFNPSEVSFSSSLSSIEKRRVFALFSFSFLNAHFSFFTIWGFWSRHFGRS